MFRDAPVDFGQFLGEYEFTTPIDTTFRAAAARVSGPIGWALPAFSEFDIKSQIVHGLPVPIGLVLSMVGYSAIYSAAAIGLSVVLFARREFK